MTVSRAEDWLTLADWASTAVPGVRTVVASKARAKRLNMDVP